MKKKIHPMFYPDIIRMYDKELISMIDIAATFDVSRQTIHSRLRMLGINTTKRRIHKICNTCGEVVLREKCRIRKVTYVYCDMNCYASALAAGDGHPYLPNRQGQRRARNIVIDYFDLQPANVVHHENKDCLDNRITNLKVFKNQSDHRKYHHGINPVESLWDGAQL